MLLMILVPREHVPDYPRTHKIRLAHSLKNAQPRDRETERQRETDRERDGKNITCFAQQVMYLQLPA